MKMDTFQEATNSAIELAEGEFIAFMDCDDTIPS